MERIYSQQAQSSASRKFVARVYGWMCAALVISAVVAFFTPTISVLMRFVFGTPFGFYALALAEIALVWWLSANIQKISPKAAAIAFLVYSVVNGVTLSVVFLAYPIANIVNVFAVSALMFGAMSIYGMFTKSNLMSIGRYLMMALMGLVIATLINLFLRSSMFDYLISFAGVALFTALTAYDTYRIARTAEYADGREAFKNVAIIAALELYLDFINIFLYLLRLFGNRRR